MKYPFPYIKNISQVLPLIANKPEFVVAQRGEFTVVNYVVSMSDTFPDVVTEGDAILRELRGIIFNSETGDIISRPFHKFWNANEREETLLNALDFTKKHSVFTKLDGSMIRPFYVNGEVRFGTKMGLTDVAAQAEEFARNHDGYVSFSELCLASDMTPIFEWTSRKQRIVIDYPVDNLVLLAVRHMHTGEYFDHATIVRDFGYTGIIPVVAEHPIVKSAQEFISTTRQLKGIEGFVVAWDDGHRIKIKCEDYIIKHKSKELMLFEKNIVDIIVNEKADDIKAFLPPEDKARFEAFETKFWEGVKKTADDITGLYTANVDKYPTKKEFAVNFANKQDVRIRPYLFEIAYGRTAYELLIGYLRKMCTSQTKVDESRWVFNCKWNIAKNVLSE